MKKILLDCGSHKGESVKKFKTLLTDFNEYEIYMFEPNNNLFKIIESNPEFYSYTKFQKAVSDKEEIVKFYGGTVRTDNCGATILLDKKNYDAYKDDDYELVQTVDISKFIKDNFSIEDHIILKLDVEGAEYQIIEKLLNDDAFKYIKKLYMEWHTQWLPNYKQTEIDLVERMKKINVSYEYWDALN
jgi:FkbM family methyltransferase